MVSSDQRDGWRGWKVWNEFAASIFQFGINSILDFFPKYSLFSPKLWQSILNWDFESVLCIYFVLSFLVELEREGWGWGSSFSHIWKELEEGVFFCFVFWIICSHSQKHPAVFWGGFSCLLLICAILERGTPTVRGQFQHSARPSSQEKKMGFSRNKFL